MSPESGSREPECRGSVEWADHDWTRTVRGGYVVRIYCSRCSASPTDMLNRPVLSEIERLSQAYTGEGA